MVTLLLLLGVFAPLSIKGLPCSYPCATRSSHSMGSNGLAMLEHFEGFSPTCYKDTEGIWTIGIGHACLSSSTDLPEFGVTCTAGRCSGSLTKSQAREVLARDLSFFQSCVNRAVNTNITQNQFDALVSFAYNVGCGGFQDSTLLRHLNNGRLTDGEAQYQLSRWHSGCTEGLKRRRFTESLLFSTCTTNFACSSSGCNLSQNYRACHGGCQYCEACSGCSGSSGNMPECAGGGGGGGGGTCNQKSCHDCIRGGGGRACATGSCAGCSKSCTDCVANAGGTACVDRC